MLKLSITQDKNLLIHLMKIQELDLKLFAKQIKKPQERDLKY